MKRILFYTDCYICGGSEKALLELITSQPFLSRYDFRFFYRWSRAYYNGLNSMYPSLAREKTRRVFFPAPDPLDPRLNKLTGSRAPWLIRAAAELAKAFLFVAEVAFLSVLFLFSKAGVVHVNTGGYPAALSCRAAVVAARCAGKRRVILSVNNLALPARGIVEMAIDILVRACVWRVITGSRAAAAQLVRARNFDPGKVISIYHGASWPPAGAARGKSEPYESAKMPPGPMIMVALFEERKGHRYVIAALKKLISDHPELSSVRLLLLNEGELFKDIRALVAQEGLENNVTFLGFRKDRIELIASSVLLLNPSLEGEDLPHAVLEAMSVGVPVIGTDVAGIPEEIEDGVTGFIVKPADAGAIARCMYVLLSDKEKREAMAVASRRRFEALFTLEKMTGRYLRLYEEAQGEDGHVSDP